MEQNIKTPVIVYAVSNKLQYPIHAIYYIFRRLTQQPAAHKSASCTSIHYSIHKAQYLLLS
jgi:hypothetical protein